MMALARRRFKTTLLALSLLAATPAAAQRGTPRAGSRAAAAYENPVSDVDFPDPTVVRAPDGHYYAYAVRGPVAGRVVNIQVARSRSATGPLEKMAAVMRAPDSVILRRRTRWVGPGHNSVFTDAAGRGWIAYRAIDARRPYLETEVSGDRAVRRVMLIDRLAWRGGWPRVESSVPSGGGRPAPPAARRRSDSRPRRIHL